MAKRHQDYDKILRENAERVANIILSRFMGIPLSNIEKIATHLPRTIDRRPDYVIIASDDAGQKNVQHFEFQTKSELNMPPRMLLYFALLYDIYRLPVHQYVVYIGSGKWTAPTKIDEKNCQFGYTVICLNEIDYNVFLEADTPEEIIIAILADFKNEKNSEVVLKILECLKNKEKNQQKLQKYLFQLEILSNLRNLQPEIIKTLSNMPLTYDITTDLRFQEGEARGKALGEASGEARAEKRSAEKFVLNLLHSTDFDDEKIANLANVDIAFVKTVRERLKE